jgi:hypothetical protein
MGVDSMLRGGPVSGESTAQACLSNRQRAFVLGRNLEVRELHGSVEKEAIRRVS